MSPWELRYDLARRGWTTEVRLGHDGFGRARSGDTRASFGIWARTWHWHGRVHDVCLHDHEILDLAQEDAIQRMTDRIGRVHEVCLRAWAEYPDVFPTQVDRNPDGTIGLAANTWGTERRGPYSPDFEPTELLLADAAPLADGGSHLPGGAAPGGSRRASCRGLD